MSFVLTIEENVRV